MFGEDSDSEEDDYKGLSSTETAARLRVAANDCATSLQSHTEQILPYAEVKDNIVEIGGGRGVFAKMNLQPGCLVMSEISSIEFRDSSDLDDPSEFIHTVEEIIKDQKAKDCCSVLHPISINFVSKEDIERMRSTWNEEALISTADRLQCSQEEIIRVGLALQHNGFSSGLYHTLTKVNHSCFPNCIKFKPTAQSNWASEIWTTRPVREGEELTICYCEPMEMTTRSMREYLFTQHRFTCLCELCTSLKISHELSLDANSSLVELDRKQDMLSMAERELSFISIEEHNDRLRICKKMIALGEKSLLKDIDSMFAQCSKGDTAKEIVMVRSLKVMKIRVLKHLVQAAAVSIESYSQTHGVKKSVLFAALCTYVGASNSLLGLQKEVLGDDHCDLGTTYADLAEGLQCLLASTSIGGKLSSSSNMCLPQDIAQKLQAPPYAFEAVSDYNRFKNMMSTAETEARRLKALYNTRLKYPEALVALRESGDVFWGGEKP